MAPALAHNAGRTFTLGGRCQMPCPPRRVRMESAMCLHAQNGTRPVEGRQGPGEGTPHDSTLTVSAAGLSHADMRDDPWRWSCHWKAVPHRTVQLTACGVQVRAELPQQPSAGYVVDDDCGQVLGMPKVALLFLTRGPMAQEALWAKWFEQAAGKPRSCPPNSPTGVILGRHSAKLCILLALASPLTALTCQLMLGTPLPLPNSIAIGFKCGISPEGISLHRCSGHCLALIKT